MALQESLKRGTVELLLLTLLQDGDMYGYQLSQELCLRSYGLYKLQESSMYPILYRLLDKKMISDRQERVGKRRMRVYYHLEPQGQEYLFSLRQDYLALTRGVLHILDVNDIKEMAPYEEDCNR